MHRTHSIFHDDLNFEAYGLRVRDELAETERTLALSGSSDSEAASAASRGGAQAAMQAQSLASEQRIRARIQELREALVRIEKQEFGICRDCAERISTKRLEADVATLFCVRCEEEKLPRSIIRDSVDEERDSL